MRDCRSPWSQLFQNRQSIRPPSLGNFLAYDRHPGPFGCGRSPKARRNCTLLFESQPEMDRGRQTPAALTSKLSRPPCRRSLGPTSVSPTLRPERPGDRIGLNAPVDNGNRRTAEPSPTDRYRSGSMSALAISRQLTAPEAHFGCFGNTSLCGRRAPTHTAKPPSDPRAGTAAQEYKPQTALSPETLSRRRYRRWHRQC